MVTVSGTSGPWLWQNVGLNSSFQYDSHNDEGAPVVVTTGGGVLVTIGEQITETYVSGGVTATTGSLPSNANGNGVLVNNNVDPSFGAWPSYYIPASDYPIYGVELVGTFADSNGNIVGTPFPIGLSSTEIVPNGASRLQLGVNDNYYVDNSGSLLIQVSSSPVPEPIGICDFGCAAIASLALRTKRCS